MKTPIYELKSRARAMLTGRYWPTVGIVMLSALIIYVCSFVVSMLAMSIVTFAFIAAEETLMQNSALMTLLPSLLVLLLSVPVALFAQFPLTIGMYRYFIKLDRREQKIDNLFFAYRHRLSNVILTCFLMSLYEFLWSLLFVVPGIIKAYEYSMIPFILAENPSVDRKRAFEISRALTKGNKFRIFLLELSFIGWILLSVLTFGIGLVFLQPYVTAAYSHMYFDLKARALNEGTVSPQDFEFNEII